MRYRTLTPFLLLPFLMNNAAWAGCAEDLTRIQLALPGAAPDIQSRASALITDARNKAKAKDGAGCEASTTLALQSLDLPRLAPIVLSTPTTQQAESNSPSAVQVKVASTAADNVTSTAKANPSAQEPKAPAPVIQASPAPPTQAPAPAASGGAEPNKFFIVTSDVIGLDVTNSNATGETLGRLSSLIIDGHTGVAQYAVIDRGGVLGWDRHHVIVPFQLLTFRGQWDRPSLNMSAFKLENGPHVSDQDITTLLSDPAWLRSLADYFGVALASGPGTESASASPQSGSNAQAAQAAGQPNATTTGTTGSANPSDAAARGQTIAQHYCSVCHTLNSGGNTLVGPNLYGVVGRPVASVSGYNYSDALKGHHGNWDPASLDAFLKSPRTDVPGTHMTFPGISSTHDRQDVIAYLQTLGAKTGANK